MNGQPRGTAAYKQAYVQQEDMFYAQLTVRWAQFCHRVDLFCVLWREEPVLDSDVCAVHGLDEAAVCRETLNMAAALRLPRSMSSAEKEAAADALIRRLGLTGSADTPVGERPSLWLFHSCALRPNTL